MRTFAPVFVAMCMFATSEATNTESKWYADGDTTCTGTSIGTGWHHSITNTPSSKTYVYCSGDFRTPCTATGQNGYIKEVYTCASDGGVTTAVSFGVSSDGSGTPLATTTRTITAAMYTKMMAGECFTSTMSVSQPAGVPQPHPMKFVNPSNLPQWCLPTPEPTNTEYKEYAYGDTTCSGAAQSTRYQYSIFNTASSKTSVYCDGTDVNTPCVYPVGGANGYRKQVYTCASDGGVTIRTVWPVHLSGTVQGNTVAHTATLTITAAMWTKARAGECFTLTADNPTNPGTLPRKYVNPSNLPQWCLPSAGVTPAPTPAPDAGATSTPAPYTSSAAATASSVVAATVSLAGITLAQFDAAAKTAFKEVVATYLSICGTAGASQCTASDVTIISAARRDVAVKFEVKTSSSTKAVAGATTLNAAITTNAVAFKDQLVAKGGALASVSGTGTVAAAASAVAAPTSASAAGVTATPSMLVVSSVLAMLGMIKSM